MHNRHKNSSRSRSGVVQGSKKQGNPLPISIDNNISHILLKKGIKSISAAAKCLNDLARMFHIAPD